MSKERQNDRFQKIVVKTERCQNLQLSLFRSILCQKLQILKVPVVKSIVCQK